MILRIEARICQSTVTKKFKPLNFSCNEKITLRTYCTLNTLIFFEEIWNSTFDRIAMANRVIRLFYICILYISSVSEIQNEKPDKYTGEVSETLMDAKPNPKLSVFVLSCYILIPITHIRLWNFKVGGS